MFRNKNENLIDRFEDWWRRDSKGLPLMWIVARKDGANTPGVPPRSTEDIYIGKEFLLGMLHADVENCLFLGDSYAQTSASIGPGCLNVYLGAKPVFAPSTVWYEPCLSDINDRPPIRFDPESY